MQQESPYVLVRDAAAGSWVSFSRPHRVITTRRLDEVAGCLNEIDAAVTRSGYYAAGFLSFDSWPAFYPGGGMFSRPSDRVPLLWFGLFETAERLSSVPLPEVRRLAELQWRATITPEEYERRFDRIRHYLASGDTYQVNLTFPLRARADADPWPLFLELVGEDPPPHAAYVNTGDLAVLSASPELFFELNGDKIVSRPMKGTAPRGRDAAEDELAKQTLVASEKNLAENLMIVDMVRNDLGRTAISGTVNAPRLFQVEAYPTVWQLTSTVEAQTCADFPTLMQSLFPAASITGAPKKRALEIIAECESSPRNVYTGAVGFYGPGRRAHFNVAIRTMLLDLETSLAEYGVGGGIVWDSVCEDEWRECHLKARILTQPTSREVRPARNEPMA